ncbi:MAG: hypothetical protein HY925_02110 [Elusimicrobia bacterium]|nr:hypothetical protein [Elusimicrobiota bacterium]
MKTLRLAVGALTAMFALGTVGWAASMSGPNNEIVPVAVDPGGQHDMSSTNNKILNSIGERGAKELSSTSHFIHPGAFNVLPWPERMMDFVATVGPTEGILNLAWTAPKADGDVGTATLYDIRYSVVAGNSPAISEAKFQAAASVSAFGTIPAPSAPGTAESMQLEGLALGVQYYFAIKAKSAWAAWSYVSPEATETAPTNDTVAPTAVSNLAVATGDPDGWLDVSFNVTGDNGAAGAFSSGQYKIIYALNAGFTGAVTITEPLNQAAGSVVNYSIGGLQQNALYYVKVQLADEVPNWSADSNVDSANAGADAVAPNAADNLDAVVGVNVGELKLTWDAKGDNGAAGNIAGGKVRIDYTADPGHTWNVGTYQIELTGVNTSPGAPQSYTIPNLDPETLYYAKIYLADEVPNFSAASNQATGNPKAPSGPSDPCNTCSMEVKTITRGGRLGVSASHRSINAVGESNEKELASASYKLQPGFGNLIAWPETLISFIATQGDDSGKIRLNWTAPKADGDVGTAAVYDIRYSLVAADSPAISEAKFLAANSVTDFAAIPAPSAPGPAEQLDLTGLPCGNYYFAIKARASWSGWSHVSPAGNATTINDYGAQLAVSSVDMGERIMGSEFVVPTGISVTNAGYCPATFSIKAEPITGGTPWTIAPAPGEEAFTVQAAFNTAEPALGDFEDADKLSTTPDASTPTKFALDQTGVSVPGGDSRMLWVKVGMPLTTGTVDTQQIRLTVYGLEP